MVSAARLLRALAASAAEQGCAPALTLAATRDWASALFVGARFDVAIVVADGPAARSWLDALPESDLTMPRQFAGDVRVVTRSRADGQLTASLEALVLAD